MLHIINKSPFRNATLDECVRFAIEGDLILLIEDGVFALQAGSVYAEKLQKIREKNRIYALKPDVQARGIERIAQNVTLIDYDGFVDLVAEHKCHTWL